MTTNKKRAPLWLSTFNALWITVIAFWVGLYFYELAVQAEGFWMIFIHHALFFIFLMIAWLFIGITGHGIKEMWRNKSLK